MTLRKQKNGSNLLTSQDLESYQLRGVKFLIKRKKCALWMRMGLGKTVTTLTAIRILKQQKKVNRVLVVAPLRVARKVWPDEVNSWAHLRKKLTIATAVGTPKQRIRALQQKVDIHTINFENLRWLTDFFRKKGQSRMRHKWRWDLVVIDESSAFKNGKHKDGPQRWQAFYRVFKHTERIWELTGSPGQLIDLWGQIYFLDEGKALGTTLGAYRERWFYKPEHKFNYIPFPHAEKEIHARIKHLTLTMRAEDYMNLPPIMINPIRVSMSPREMEQYRFFCKRKWVELCGEKLTAANAGVLFQKCVQFANGAVYYNDEKEWIEFFDGKIQALKEYMQLSLYSSSPMLIIYAFKHDLIRIQQLAKSLRVKNFRVLKNEKDEDDWNAGKLDFLAFHPKGGGHGLNLQHGGSEIFWFSLTPSLEYYEQVRDRLAGGKRRIGKNVIMHTLVTENTSDEDLPLILEHKEGVQDRIFEALKDRFDFIK